MLEMTKPRETNRRIALTLETIEEFRDFSSGMRLSHDETLAAMLAALRRPDETAFEAGRRLREALDSPPNDTPPKTQPPDPNAPAKPRGTLIGSNWNPNRASPKPGSKP